MTRGKFITFEGTDASGKSTQAALLQQTLQKRGVSVIRTREPGGTPIGERIREVALHEEGLDGRSETLLMFAARREHIARKIAPALADGVWVICDRFTDSTLAYQGGGRGVALEFIRQLAEQVQDGIQPDLTFYLHSPPLAAANPLFAKETFERENRLFYQRVHEMYQQLARQDPERIAWIDNSDSKSKTRRDRDDIAEEIRRLVIGRLL